MVWLIEAFGFVDAERRLSVDGLLTHGELLSEMENTPDGRRHRAEDIEGHRWMFEEGGITI